MDNNLVVISENIEISELSNGDLSAKFCISDFSVNKNGKRIDINSFDNWKDTLVNMPLVGKVAKIGRTNEEDFTSHNRKTKYERIGNEVKKTTYLDTDAFGVFNNCYTEEIDGVKYIMAECQIWTSRFKNVKNIILSKLEKGESIASSWEIIITDSEFRIENGSTYELIKDGYFIGHCLLGRNPKNGVAISPAYDCSRILEVAEEELDEELSSAIAQDIDKIEEGGDEEMADINEIVEEVVETVEETVEGQVEEPVVETTETEKQVETSALSMGDLRRKVCQMAYELEGEENYCLCNSIIYPTENTAYFSKEGFNSLEEDYLKIVYSIDEEDNITIVSKEDVKMTFVPKETVVEVSELEAVKVELSEKINSIVDLGKTIAEKDVVISQKDELIAELEVFKTKVMEIEKEEAEKQFAAKKKACRKAALSSGYITEEDIEASEELKEAIEQADENKVMIFIASAVLKANAENIEVSESVNEDEEVEVSTTLGNDYDYGEIENPILNYIKTKKNKRR